MYGNKQNIFNIFETLVKIEVFLEQKQYRSHDECSI